MADPNAIAQAFRLLQAGDANGALALARLLLAADPSLARAHLVAGMALRALGRLGEAAPALDRAATLDPRDFAAAYERALLHSLRGESDAALGEFERALKLRPGFAPAAYAAGLARLERRQWREAIAHLDVVLAADARNIDAMLARAHALFAMGRHDEADAQYDRAILAAPGHSGAQRAHGQFLVARGRFDEAAARFAAAATLNPADHDVRLFLAQALLVRGRLHEGWAAYGQRESRRAHEALRASQGAPYRPAALEALRERDVRIVAEQGLGDILFFLRWAPALRQAGARLAFSGDARLHPLLAPTGLFEHLDADTASPPGAGQAEILSADLPTIADLAHPAPIALVADPDRTARWRAALEACGPRPWIGVTWRAGTPRDVLAHGLEKLVPMPAFFEAVGRIGGTVIALQRKPLAGELAEASRALGATVHDFSGMNDDLEDALALLALLDRHLGVSNTNMHLAAGLGAGADVIVPFPPEFRWGDHGGTSPWFPGFRVHRQAPGGDWAAAFSGLR